MPALLLLLSGAAAFAPAAQRSLSMTPPLAPARAAQPQMVGTVGKILALPTMYALMSVNEYVTHRYFQHAEFNKQAFLQRASQLLTGKPIKVRGGGHVEHHAETYDDMSLKNDERWKRTPAAASLNDDVFRGTAFSWKVSGLMCIQMLPTTLPAYAALGFTLPATVALLLPSMLLHALLWNALHPPMHGLGNVPISYGAPSSTLSRFLNSRYFKWIYENHMGHHVLGGQCNYNVCCPLTDHLVGTFVPTKDWAPKMRPLPRGAEIIAPAVAPRGVPQLPEPAAAAPERVPALVMREQRDE